MSDQPGDLLPLQDEQESGGFDVVLRGYDRRQVEDYVERVEAVLAAADRKHADDEQRLQALETQVLGLQSQLTETERRAAGRPEPASLVGERIATMLRLAEEEAEQIVDRAREQASRTMAERTEELDRREAAIATAATEADQVRLEAQQDAQGVRSRAQEEAQALLADARRQADELTAQVREQAEAKRRQAEEDVSLLHDAARAESAAMTQEARRQVEELSLQRDTIAAQLQALRETLSAAVGPLGTAPPAVTPAPGD